MKLKFILVGMSIGIASVVAQNSPYVTKVYDFVPAPGQFVNTMPEYEEGDIAEDIARKAGEYIVGEENGSPLSLGAWGGYVVVGFDHTIVNVEGEYDFKVYGNAFYATANPNPDVFKGGSCEPGIVMVAYDENKNGVPDDNEWYELAGSEYYKPETRRNYELVYYKPDPDKEATPHPTDIYLNDTSYIAWKDNLGNTGYVERNVFHSQSYWPEWIQEDSLLFRGTRLADNGVDEGGQRNNFILYAYDWGYADNHPNGDEGCNFKIDWAVDTDGQPVHLPGVDFIKIYTGVLQMNGWIGECSTEVSGVTDLHPNALPPASAPSVTSGEWTVATLCGDVLLLTASTNAEAGLYTLSGERAGTWRLTKGGNELAVSHLPVGLYVLVVQSDAGQRLSFKVAVNH